MPSAAARTAEAWSRVSDLMAARLAFRGVGQGRDVAGDQVAGFGVPDGALEREVPHGNRRGGVPGRHGGQRLPDVGRGQVAELAGADDGQDRLEHVLVLGDGLGGAAVEPVGEPVLGGLPDGVVRLRPGVTPFSRSVCRSRSLSTTAALVLPLTFRRWRFPSPVYPRLARRATGRGSAGGGRCHGTAVFEGDAVFAAPAPGAHGCMIAGGGQSVVTTASLAQPTPRHISPRSSVILLLRSWSTWYDRCPW